MEVTFETMSELAALNSALFQWNPASFPHDPAAHGRRLLATSLSIWTLLPNAAVNGLQQTWCEWRPL